MTPHSPNPRKPANPLKSAKAVLLASAVAVTALAVTPNLGAVDSLMALNAARAEAVKLPAPANPGFADVVEAVSPAVVSVRVENMVEPASDDGEFRFDRRGGDDRMPEFFRRNPEFFKRFFGDQFGERGPRGDRPHGRRFGMSQGSGFFISEDGYLVTNNHVIDGGSKYTVVMDDGTELAAKLIGADKRSDLAVLKVDDDRKFTYVDFASDEPRIGDWVVAVGNPFGLGGTVTAGIVSAQGREIGSNRYDDFIQIDAAVNKGNSGGPAFNLKGEVIGVNTAIFSPSGGNVGIAFAIPASTTQEIVGEIIDKGSVVRGWLGVQIQPVTGDIAEALSLGEARGALVSEPQEDSPAAKAGIRSGDVITEVDGKPVRGPRMLARMIGERDPDETVTLTIVRGGNEEKVEVKLGTLNEAAMASTEDNGDQPMDKSENTGKLGLALGEAPDGGVMVLGVRPDSAADDKGVQEGDVIGQVNGEEVKTPDDVARLVKQAEDAGRKSTLFRIERDGNARFVAIPFPKA
ncbi:MAG: Do family serine endopeptidase [Nitratireductor sp.]|nr:Do family serine endopeptidase [Nitratireductor sp.]